MLMRIIISQIEKRVLIGKIRVDSNESNFRMIIRFKIFQSLFCTSFDFVFDFSFDPFGVVPDRWNVLSTTHFHYNHSHWFFLEFKLFSNSFLPNIKNFGGPFFFFYLNFFFLYFIFIFFILIYFIKINYFY